MVQKFQCCSLPSSAQSSVYDPTTTKFQINISSKVNRENIQHKDRRTCIFKSYNQYHISKISKDLSYKLHYLQHRRELKDLVGLHEIVHSLISQFFPQHLCPSLSIFLHDKKTTRCKHNENYFIYSTRCITNQWLQQSVYTETIKQKEMEY